MTLGNRIKKYRLSLHLTQTELSKQLNLTPRMISFYENDERTPPADILVKLSKILGISSDYLLGLSNEEPNVSNLKTITISAEEDFLLSQYRKLNKDYKDIVIGELKKCVKIQEYELQHNIEKSQEKKQA